MKATKMDMELRYDDDSGVEFAVRLDNTDPLNAIEFERWGQKCTFPADKIDWLLEALYRLRAELPPPVVPPRQASGKTNE